MILDKQRIAILASGSGSNAERIIRHFKESSLAEVTWVGSNRTAESSGIFARTKGMGLETVSFTREDLFEGRVTSMLVEAEIDWVVLAGFLMRIPISVIQRFHRRMVNIHPSLLPDFGGKGMYGLHVHRAVQNSGRTETGMTVHYVTQDYDEGEIVFQAECSIEAGLQAEEIARKVQELEHAYFPTVIESLVRGCQVNPQA